MSSVLVLRPCAACGRPAEGRFSIHRDGFCVGPEVDLCDACGSEPEPTLADLWASIAERLRRGERMAE